MNKFRLHTPRSEKKGRPVHMEMMDEHEKVCWLENASDCDLYTLKELHEKMTTLSNNGEVYTIKTFKQNLLERYRDNIYFAQLPGRENVIGFRNMTDQILSDLKKKEQQTKTHIIIAAEKFVKADIREIDY